MGYFLPFYPPNSPKNQNFEKMKKTPGDIIILHTCTINYDQMLYSSWDMVHDRCNCYFSFWVIFCPFTPLTAQKMKVLKKWKKHLEISSFYICVPKIMTRWCMVPEMRCVTDVIVISHFGLFFCPFTPLTAQKIKILKKWRKSLEISSFYIYVPKIMIRWHTVPEIWCTTDERTDRKWHIEVGVPPKNTCCQSLQKWSEIELCSPLYGFIKNLWQIHLRDSHMKFTGKNKVSNTTRAKLCSLIGQKW